MSFLYQQLAAQLVEQIAIGHYRPGERLPGVRRFSAQHRVSTATSVAVYRKLEDEGYVEARSRSGFYVRLRPSLSSDEPEISKPKNRPSPVTGQDLALQLVKASNQSNMIQLGAAVPAPVYLPTRQIEKAMAKSNRLQSQRSAGYEFPPGVPELRRQIARRLGEIGCSVSADEIVITNGCQEALTLALRATTQPGDVVAIESPTFYGLLQVIESLGLKALEIPTHPRDGISLQALQMALEQWPVKACILVPNYSNPLGYCMNESHKRDLVALLTSHQIPLIEDDVYGDLGFSQQRPGVCKSYDQQGLVLHCSSVSKTLSPGLRVGWIVPGDYLQAVEYLKFVTNLATPTLPQLAVAQLLENGQYERHLRKTREDYAQAVERMSNAVESLFPKGTRITRPQGGFVIWVELPDKQDSFSMARDLLHEGISIAPGPIFSATAKYQNFMRLSCACEWNEDIERALARIAACF
ncbi:MAG: PLP-dependent aminotransferase family protein [Candidatus Thiodiazotropha sp. (ex Ctena orbiculata)]|nr:PLP-dependent aminotransferase family protein [Candidatus Thiodiazotropha taylori]